MKKKRRADAWDSGLNDEQRWAAYDEALKVPWYAFAQWCADTHGVRPGKTAVYEWMAHMRALEGAHRLERAIAARKELSGLAKAAELDAQTADAYMALANDALLSGNPEKAAQIVAAAVQINAASLRMKEQQQKDARLELEQRKLDLQREKFEAAEKRLDEAKATVADETLTDEERLSKIRNIFGLK